MHFHEHSTTDRTTNIACSKQWISLARVTSLFQNAILLSESNERSSHLKEQVEQIVSGTSANLDFLSGYSPKRLETYILNQGESKYRGLVELITNGIDAYERRIGRFGMGFLQSLSFLIEEGDLLSVVTYKEGAQQVKIDFRKIDGDVQVSFSTPIEDERIGHPGTTIAFCRATSNKEEATALNEYCTHFLNTCQQGLISINGTELREHRNYQIIGQSIEQPHYTPSVEVSITENGFLVCDFGRGMDANDVATKLLIPKLNEPSKHLTKDADNTTLLYDPKIDNNSLTSCNVRMQVSGVLVESITVQGLNLPQGCVIELPSNTWLPESRNQLQLNHQVSGCLIALANRVVAEAPTEHTFALLNVIGGVATQLQSRPGQIDDCTKEVAKIVDVVLEDRKIAALPNSANFKRINISSINNGATAYIDPSIMRINVASLGLKPLQVHIPQRSAHSRKDQQVIQK